MEPRARGKRVYNTERRAEQARLTRVRIIDAARDLLLADGFFAMTVPLLAQRAGVSPQTVYNAIGGKAEVVKAVYEFAAEHPEVLGYTPCYCGCEREAGHKGNDDCFVAERNSQGDVTRWDPHGVT